MTGLSRILPFRRAELRPLYDPASIAVIGASPRAGSFGARTLANLTGFKGRVFPVNERYGAVAGMPCFPTVASLPERPDVAVVTTPAASAEQIVAECVEAGIPSVILYASGFAELGPGEAAATQDRVVRRAAVAGMRLLGPNCVGLLNFGSGARMTFAGVPDAGPAVPHAIGLISQSGALGFALAQAMDRGTAISHVLTSGNAGDVDTADWVAVLAEDPACAAIACIFEGLASPLRLLAAAELARENGKPLIVYKLATGAVGAAAAMSHTGSLAGEDASWRSLLDRAGAVTVERYEDLVETAAFFAKAGRPAAAGAAVLAGSGGAAILGADCAERHGVKLPQPSEPVRLTLESRIPAFGSARNPCDVTAQVISDSPSLMDCAGALLSDPAYGALVYGYTYAYGPATDRLPRLSALARQHGKPVCAVWLTQFLEGPGSAEVEADPHIAMFRSMDRCFAALAAWSRWDSCPAPSGPQRAGPVLTGLVPVGASMLGERGTKRLLAAYGVAVSADTLATDAAGAAAAAERIGGPVVLKVDSPDIAHKTEAGGVALGVQGRAKAAVAFDAIVAACRHHQPHARIDGVLVAEMVPAGIELIVGIKNDDAFGPMLVVGLGGVFAELLRDTATALAPVDEAEAARLLARLRGAALLDGFRGSPPVDRGALCRAISAISRLGSDLRATLRELDVNPLICRGERIIAVDGLARFGS